MQGRGDERQNANLKGDGRRARDGEERPDAEIERAGKEQGKTPPHPVPDRGETVARRDADRRNAEQGQPHACDTEPNEGGQHLHPRPLSHRRGKDQIARTEDQTEEERCDKEIFLFRQPLFHTGCFPIYKRIIKF